MLLGGQRLSAGQGLPGQFRQVLPLPAFHGGLVGGGGFACFWTLQRPPTISLAISSLKAGVTTGVSSCAILYGLGQKYKRLFWLS
jgi:hypothetical protein